jgi:hypothetical protein
MSMYKYYQRQEKAKWHPIADDPDSLDARLVELDAKRVTILSLSEQVTDDTQQEEIAYRGPLYFDIDYKDDIGVAIESAKKLVTRLKELDVPEQYIRVVASGSKGLHVKVPEKVFSAGRPFKRLPLIYMEIAKELHVLGMDFQVYNQGKGTCWRIENVKREGTGTYPVPITHDELNTLTAETYKSFVEAPRALPLAQPKNNKEGKAPGLVALFDKCHKVVKTTKAADHTALADSELIKIKDITPNCINELADYNIRDAYNFNQVAMQMGAYVARSGITQDVSDPLISRMAESSHSSQYPTPRDRHTHLRGMLSYAKKAKGLVFSCRAIRGVLDRSVCEGCPINTGPETNAELDMGLIEKTDGYYQVGAKSDVRISTFVLDPISVHLMYDKETQQTLRVATDFDILVSGTVVGTTRFDEASWANKIGFLRELEGVTNLSFIGSDTDVQKIKHLMYTEDREMGEITQVETAGIHLHQVGDRTIRVYVEPGFSISELRLRGSHRLTAEMSAPPHLSQYKLIKPGDPKVTAALSNLLRSNGPIEVAQILGWFCASHSKLAFMQKWNQFPLLNIWGGAGVGKSKTAALFSRLSGCDYRMQDSPLTLGSISRFAIVHYCSGTTTIPRLLDEYNASKLSREMYNYCGEIMKAAWGGAVVSKGTVARKTGQSRSSASAYDIPISAPLLIMSEQSPEVPALVQRSVQVMLTRASREGRTQFFDDAEESTVELFQVAKALMTQALTLDTEFIKERMAHWAMIVPKTLDDRPRFSYQVILTGLDLFKACCMALKLPVLDDIDDLTDALAEYLATCADDLNKKKSFSEVDGVLEDLGVIIALQAEDDAKVQLVYQKHFYISGDRLFIDPVTCHAKYKSYKRSIGEVPVIKSSSQLCSLIKDEPYYTQMTICDDMGIHRNVIQLSLERLDMKSLDRTLFESI